ncbi:hypothetical protein [Oceaniglobus roseus]|uniref:hypothetical protein n=1 Tax=Oceaniglobus roseus TaxID=1737570 RepID=UPI000C7F3F3A|nr:hypothetical protein [Kandeliimicrobium roseum]
MRGSLLFALLLTAAGRLAAQGWQAELSDDGGYAIGTALYSGLPLVFDCAARSVQNPLPADRMWPDYTHAPPWQVLIGAGDALVRASGAERADILLLVDQTGYRLPPLRWNGMDEAWQVALSMGDPMLAALRSASRLVMQVGTEAAWEIPVAGLGAALDAAQAYCGAAWVAAGEAPPPGIAAPPAAPPALPSPQGGAFALPSQIQAHADAKCEGRATISPDALQAGDLDGDGAPDVVMDWGGVQCAGRTSRLFCGAANCSLDVFASSRGYGDPIHMLGTALTFVALPSGGLGLKLDGTYSICGETDCDAPFVWSGNRLVQLKP